MPPLLIAYAAASLAVLLFHAVGCVGLVRVLLAERAFRRSGAVAGPRPIVEIVVAVRDEEATLPGLLASLARQTDRTCRFLLVDDRSTDGTGEIGRKYGERIRYLRQENQGPGAAKNLGIRNSRGALIATFFPFRTRAAAWRSSNRELTQEIR